MTTVFFLIFAGVLALSESLHILGVASDLTRKLVHTTSAILLCFFPWLFMIDQAMAIALLCLIMFAVVESYGLLESVTDVKRASIGGISFVVGVAVSALLVQQNAWLPFQVGLLVLAISDTGAALVGQYIQKSFQTEGKTYQGSLTFFFLTLAIFSGAVAMFVVPITAYVILSVLLFSFSLTLVEYYSPYGLDNLFLPILSMMMLSVLL